MHFFLAVAVLVVTMTSVAANATNLVVNGGFESGGAALGNGLYSPVAWTLVDPSNGSGSTNNGPGYTYLGLSPYEGSWYFWAGAYNGTVGTLSQTITDVAGQKYNLSFELANSNNDLPANNYAAVLWNGAVLGHETNAPTYGYTMISFVVTGTGSDTVAFQFNNEPGALALDAVNVSAVPIPASLLLFAPGLLGLVGMRKRGKI